LEALAAEMAAPCEIRMSLVGPPALAAKIPWNAKPLAEDWSSGQ
jgi:hypothetical protein